jgi:putative transposase
MSAVDAVRPRIGVKRACSALGVPRASYYRRRWPPPIKRARPKPRRALTAGEQAEVLEVLHSPRFVDRAPAQVYAALLDEGRYLCSIRSMYRILGEHGESRERRDQCRRPAYARPELLATAPNQVWSWDITKLRGPRKWTYFYLYVLLDIFSRYVVGWLLAQRESAALAKELIEESTRKQGIKPGQLLVHADRGSPMVARSTALLMSDLGITPSHSRPHVSNDNPFSEAQFKTLKYRPTFSDRFGSLEDARGFCRPFFSWYNTEHYHSGLGLLTPHDVHYNRHQTILRGRQVVLDIAYARHPERFVRQPPTPQPAPTAVWINPPVTSRGDMTIGV